MDESTAHYIGLIERMYEKRHAGAIALLTEEIKGLKQDQENDEEQIENLVRGYEAALDEQKDTIKNLTTKIEAHVRLRRAERRERVEVDDGFESDTTYTSLPSLDGDTSGDSQMDEKEGLDNVVYTMDQWNEMDEDERAFQIPIFTTEYNKNGSRGEVYSILHHWPDKGTVDRYPGTWECNCADFYHRARCLTEGGHCHVENGCKHIRTCFKEKFGTDAPDRRKFARYSRPVATAENTVDLTIN